VRIAEAVHPLADFADVLPGRIEFEQVGGGVSVQRARCRRAWMIQHDNGPFRVDRDAQHFAEVHPRRQLQRIGYRLELEDRRLAVVNRGALLRHRGRNGRENRNCEHVDTSHGFLLRN
jgi:hypothetical protein